MSVIDNARRIRIARGEDIRRCAAFFRDTVSALCGLKIAATHNIARNATPVDRDGKVLAVAVFGWGGNGREWWRTDGLALNSPIPMACRYESEPFWINATGIYARHDNKFLEQIDLSKFEERARTHAAIVVPVHLPFGQVGAVSYNPTNTSELDLAEKFAAHGEELGLYAQTFVRSYINVTERTPVLPIRSKLTKREVECLRWAALGKTDHEISMILERSRATVRFHIRNATQKLDAVNKSQAVFKATQLGYLSFRKAKRRNGNVG